MCKARILGSKDHTLQCEKSSAESLASPQAKVTGHRNTVPLDSACHAQSLAGRRPWEERPRHKHMGRFRAQQVGFGPSLSLELGGCRADPWDRHSDGLCCCHCTSWSPLPPPAPQGEPARSGGSQAAVPSFPVNTAGMVRMATPILFRGRNPLFPLHLALALFIPGR